MSVSSRDMTSIIGWEHSAFGKLANHPDTMSLMGSVVPGAIAHAGLTPEDVDGIFVGVYNNGFTTQDFQAGLISMAVPALAEVPAARLENACATGSAALYAALDYIEAGRGKVALVVGAEKMTGVTSTRAGEILLSGCYGPEESAVESGFAGVFAGIAAAYSERYGDPSDDVGTHRCQEPSQRRDEPVRTDAQGPGVRLLQHHLGEEPDGGASACDVPTAHSSPTAPWRWSSRHPTWPGRHRAGSGFRARAQSNDFMALSKRDPLEFAGVRRAWNAAIEQAGIATLDLDLLETHDCFTIAELLQYEALGLAERGQGHRVLDEGLVAPDGKLPVNRSGGLKAKGHPIGATGVSMHAITAMQLSAEAGDMQLPGAELGGVFNMGGSAVANYASILEAW